MRLVGTYEAWATRLKDHLRNRIEHLITHSSIENADDAPYTGLGAVFSAQSDRQRVLVEYRGAFIGPRRKWGISELIGPFNGINHLRRCVNRQRMIAPQFAKLLWALQESAFPARLLFGRRGQIGVLVYDVTSHLVCFPRSYTFHCLVVSGPRSRSDKGGRIARRKCFFESFVNSALTALNELQFLFFVHWR